MPSAAAPVPRSGRAALAPGSVGFTIATSMAVGTTALAIDTILPAFDDIRADLGLAPDATQLTLLVSTFMIGFGLGQLPAGLLADRFGRRPVLWGGLAIYVLAALATSLAPSLWTMAAARFVWGLGAAGPRVAVTAMVRDAFSGERMARQMSTIMAVFLLVPMFAPSLGAALILVGSWKLTVWACALVALFVFAVAARLPATLPADQRRSLGVGEILTSWRAVLAAPGTVPYMVAITLATGVFLSYLASSENIFDAVFGLQEWFPIIFGTMALGLAFGVTLNGRVVEALGLGRMLLITTSTYLLASMAMVMLAALADGTPDFVVFTPVLLLALMASQVTIINANTAAMVPLGHVAGSGAALLGMVPLVGGSLIGSVIDQRFDGTISPLSIAFLLSSVVVFAAVRFAARIEHRPGESEVSLPGHEVDCPEIGIGS